MSGGIIITIGTSKLPDGAPCTSPGSAGVCVGGDCVSVGCDKQLNGTSYKDRCGKWCGDGSSCHQISGEVREAVFQEDSELHACVLAASSTCSSLIKEKLALLIDIPKPIFAAVP